MNDHGFRPLAIMLGAQLLLMGGVLVWAAIGFPLPSALTGADQRATTSARVAGASAGAPIAASSVVAPRPTVNRFDGPRAFGLLRAQVQEYGWRPAGSASLRRLAVHLRGLLPNGRFEPIPGQPGLRNVVGSLPGRGPAILVGAHYDVEAAPVGFVGANDGAAGTAGVVWVARALARAPRAKTDRAVRFVLFDGEEEPAGCQPFLSCGVRGSKAYAKRHAPEVKSMVLLDYVAERHNLRFTREAGSDAALWGRLRSAAAGVGAGALFSGEVSGQILDDHTPFTQRGVPAIDIIDFDYPPRDTLADTVDKVSERSLDAVGETVVRLVSTLRRG
ncbi:MAG: glutaminyl-peptide cyclotransferase [Solirubrobacteraceae bacterium]|nr:glutaminyl-peptide cyclotransferase [Solirubrobacteraceae bacterium]